MNMVIGENIKRLRKEKNVTQETLAEHLNLSCQAVSKWERGETYPDITMVMPLASYFGVSTDDLLGVDHARDEERIKTILDEYDRFSNLGKGKEACDLIRKAYREFPNDFRIIDKHMWMLLYDPYISYEDSPSGFQGIPAHMDELTKICKNILTKCTIENTRLSAISILSDIYKFQGDKEKAHELIERLPDSYALTKGQAYECSCEEGSPEWWHWIHYNIFSLSNDIICKFRNCAISSDSSPQERIKQFFKVIDFIKLLYENGDYGYAHHHLADQYLWIANRYIEMKDFESALSYIDLGLFHAKEYDELSDVIKHTSFLQQGYEFDKRKVYHGYEGNCVMKELQYIEEDDFYDPLRKNLDFQALINKYKPYAKIRE